MTPDHDDAARVETPTRAPQRVIARASARQAAPVTSVKWNRRRGVMTVFSSVAAVGFVAAAVAPAVSAVTNDPQASGVERVKTTSTYDLAREGAQTLSVDGSAKTTEISRDSYSVALKPKPTPTPTPEPVVEEASNDGGATTSRSRSRRPTRAAVLPRNGWRRSASPKATTVTSTTS